MKNRLIVIISLIVLLIGLAVYLRLFDLLGVTSNHLNIEGDETQAVIVKWVGEKETTTRIERQLGNIFDTIVLYKGNEVINEIPSRYGPNRIIVEYCGKSFYKIGVWKKKEWYKHDYNIQLSKHGSTLKIDWRIKKIFEDESGSGEVNCN
jgi:hypothetical protein